MYIYIYIYVLQYDVEIGLSVYKIGRLGESTAGDPSGRAAPAAPAAPAFLTSPRPSGLRVSQSAERPGPGCCLVSWSCPKSGDHLKQM